MIGLKSSTWTDNTYPVEDSFEADFILKIQRYITETSLLVSIVSNPNAGNSTLAVYAYNLSSTSYEAFFELLLMAIIFGLVREDSGR